MIYNLILGQNTDHDFRLVWVIGDHENTWVLITRLLQFRSHCRHLHLRRLTKLELTLVELHLQAHGKHLQASDVQVRLTLVGDENLALQFLLAIEVAQVQGLR